MTRKLVYRPEALIDLDQAQAYTRRTWGDQQARSYIAKLVIDIKALRETAFRNPLFEGVYPGLRRTRSGMHHVYYLVFEDQVEILAVIHVKRDPGARIEEEIGAGDDGDG